MSEPNQKCENNAFVMQNYTHKLFIAFKIAYFCCFSFITFTTGKVQCGC